MSEDVMRIAVLGIGNLSHGISIIFSLANYFGERPVEILLWDSDEERLDLFGTLARKCFHYTQNPNLLKTTSDADEVFEFDPDRWIVIQDARSVKKAVHSTQRILKPFIERIPQGMVLNLMDQPVPWLGESLRVEWRSTQQEMPPSSIPHQILRWINGEDHLVIALQVFEESPLHQWLDSPIGLWPRTA